MLRPSGETAILITTLCSIVKIFFVLRVANSYRRISLRPFSSGVAK